MRPLRFLLLSAVFLLLGSPAFAAYVAITSSITTNTTWGPTGTVVGSTFWVQNSININSGVTLYVQPGVVVKFSPGTYINCVGALRTMGTSGNPVYFTSIKDDNNPAGDTNGDGNATVPNTGDWYGIVFPSGSTNYASGLYWTNVKYAGYGSQGGLTFQSVSDSVVSCTIGKCYYGVDCQGTAAPVLSGTTIQASSLTPVVLDFTANPTFSSLAFSSSDNGYDAIGLRGGTLTSGASSLIQRGATVGVNPVTNVTYVLLSSLTINAGASLDIQHGIVIKPLGGWFYVYGGLTMNGTSAVGDSITITSINDDNYGNPSDTNNNGSITAPNRGDWGGIYFYQGATGALSYCRLKFGTNSTSYGEVSMLNDNIGVTNSLFSDAAHGLGIMGTSTPAITNLQINNMSSTPVLMSVSANPTYTNISLLSNAITAIGLQGEAIAVDSHLSARTLGGFANITYYLMNGGLQMLTGATLTVDPGIVIKNQIYSGGMQIDGSLVANGTAVNPIVFTSVRDDQYGNPLDTNGDGSATTPGTNDWTYIHFTDTSIDATCKLNYCRVTYASYGPFDGYNNSIWITNASPTITHCTIFKGTYGIRVEGNSAPTIATNTFDNLGGAPIVMSVLSNPTIATDNVFSATLTYNAIALISETLSQNALLTYRPGVGNAASPNFCYLPTGTITIASGVTLSIAPQVVLKPSSSFTLFNVNGALNMVGSDNAANRIFITSFYDDAIGGDTSPTSSSSPSPGNWGNIVFNPTAVSAACVIRNVKCQFGGSSGNTNGVFTTSSASPRFVHIEFFENVTAFSFYGNSAPTLDSLNIFNCTQIPICSSLISTPSYGTQIAFANNAYLGLGILGETIAQNVMTGVGKIGSYANLNYILAGNVSIAFGAAWTIQPGVVIKAGRVYYDPTGNFIDISGALIANGKPDSLIIFTSLADDAFGQDVMGDGAATKPLPYQWTGIEFEPVSNDLATVMNWCRIRYAGYGSGALVFNSAGPTISNTQISQSYTPAAYIVGASAPVFNSVDFDSTAQSTPVQMSLVSNPVFNNCRFQGNYYTALGVIPETIAQDVLWQIRPVAGRLNMPYFLNGTLTVGLGATLTMQPGVIVKMYGAQITIQRALTAIGRTVPESLIVFTSWKDDFYGGDSNADTTYTSPTSGDWGSIYIDGTAIDAQVNFKNCVFRYGNGGSTTGALRCVNSAPTVDSCLFAYNGTGLSVEGASNPLVRGCSFYGDYYYGINNTGGSFCVYAQGCWWGAANGPNDASAASDICPLGSHAGSGDAVSNNVDYTNYATAGILNPLLGDVSLNGVVMAYDASLDLQYAATLISLTPLQQLVGDVSGAAGITAYDASLILQLVSGSLRAFPPISNGARPASPEADALRAAIARAQGRFAVALGAATRNGDEWLVPVTVTGTAPAWSLELRLEQGDAATLASIAPADGGRVLQAHTERDGAAIVALAAAEPLTQGEIAVLHFPAGAGEFHVPSLEFARVNENTVPLASAPALPAVSALGAPGPNPARTAVTLQLAIASTQADTRGTVRIVDVAGRTLRTLLDGPVAAGVHPLRWDLTDDAGRAAPAGVYFVRAQAGGATFTRRLIVVR